MKGIILAGGRATRLYPITKGISKQLLPVYDKPLVYYPLSVLMLGGIRDILLIATPESLPQFQNLLGDGSDFGISITYRVQEEPRGLPEAFLLGEYFIGNDRVCLILGDNIFFGDGLPAMMKQAKKGKGAEIFGYYVKDPSRYGVITFDKKERVTSIEEKPKNPKSNWVVTGMYFFDSDVVKAAKAVKPSKRGELEIADVLRIYQKKKDLKLNLLGRGYAWLDTGTYDSSIDASMFIKTIEDRQGLKVGCIEEVAYRMGYINDAQLKRLAKNFNSDYGQYLLSLLGSRKR